jgi:hypothetical protein
VLTYVTPFKPLEKIYSSQIKDAYAANNNYFYNTQQTSNSHSSTSATFNYKQNNFLLAPHV